MIQLQQDTIECLATYLKKDPEPCLKKQLRLTFTNKEAGAEAKELLQRDLQGVLTGLGDNGGPKIARRKCKDVNTRTEAMSAIKKAVADYNAQEGPGIGDKLTKWALYLGIGALVIVICVLLWKKFKA